MVRQRVSGPLAVMVLVMMGLPGSSRGGYLGEGTGTGTPHGVGRQVT